MDNSFSELVERSRQWVDEAVAEGWLSDQDKEKIASIDLGDPARLFSESEQRPLVVAFFGGTGVGKSSLLNRLAGRNIARTGVERPTSHEVSAFIHDSVRIAHLPSDFPSEKINIVRHELTQHRKILWLDMPDIDSVARENREIVFQWLPHVDVLIYVVSPERYRDNRGWRVLLSHGYHYAWLFVMNHWDKGHPSQVDDFKKHIAQTGFHDPLVLCSDCLNDTLDDFEKLGKIIASLARENRIRQLDQRGEKIRLNGLAKAIEHCLDTLGPRDTPKNLRMEWAAKWGPARQSICAGLDWSIQRIAQDYSPTRSTLQPSETDSGMDNSNTVFGKGALMLWDDWAQTRLGDVLSGVLIQCDALAMPLKPLKYRIRMLNEKASKIIQNQAEQSLRESLARSGSGIRRVVLVFLKTASIVAPLLATTWVVYRVVNGFYQAGTSENPYLGFNFAIHSILLVVSSWFLPWFAHRQFKPSHRQMATEGLTKGLKLGLDLFAGKVDQTLDVIEEERRVVVETGRALAEQCRKSAGTKLKLDDEVLQRVLKRQE